MPKRGRRDGGDDEQPARKSKRQEQDKKKDLREKEKHLREKEKHLREKEEDLREKTAEARRKFHLEGETRNTGTMFCRTLRSRRRN